MMGSAFVRTSAVEPLIGGGVKLSTVRGPLPSATTPWAERPMVTHNEIPASPTPTTNARATRQQQPRRVATRFLDRETPLEARAP
eukprot:7085678-Prymnesium_polylepis.1